MGEGGATTTEADVGMGDRIMGASGVDTAAEDLEVVALEAVDLEEVREGLAADMLMVVALLEAMVMAGVVVAVGGTMEVALGRMEGLAPAVVAEGDEVVVVVEEEKVEPGGAVMLLK